jgi:hypothetical protein
MHLRPSFGTVAPALMTRTTAVAIAIAIAGLGAAGCKKQQQKQPTRVGRSDVAVTQADPRLPAPHKLSADVDAGVFVAAPAQLLATAGTYMPAPPTLAKLGEFVLGTQGPADFAQSAGAALDGQRPWVGVMIAREDVVHLPLQRGAASKLQSLLARYPKRGDFGAVVLPRPALALKGGELLTNTAASPERLAYVDAAAGTLTIASTLEGIATGRQLPGYYGKRPLWFTVGETRGKELLGRFPYGRVAGGGQGLHNLDIACAARPGEKLPTLRDLAPGALTGALASKGMAIGASTRWTGYKEAVREAVDQMQEAVDRAGFAGKMMLDPIANQATRLMKMWNGRVLIGLGPARHLRLGLGAEDPLAAHRLLVTVLKDVIDNLQLARMFVSNIPNATLKKFGDDPDMWLLTVSGIANNLPPDLRTITDDGRLRVAFLGHVHSGALLVVIGPKADAELKTWAGEANAATSGKDGMKDIATASLAAGPQALAPLLQIGPSEKLLPALLNLSADRAPTTVILRQDGQSYEITVRGPEAKGR